MMRSLFSGISGLKNHQTRMDVIGNNIANVNTTAFKGSRVTFQDMLSQNLAGASGPQGNRGGVNPQQIGLGMSMASIDRNFTNGNVQSTGANNDLCLTGGGFFMLTDGANTYYTRDGSFRFDATGNYVNGGGLHVQGWMADDSGNVNTNGPTENIVVPYGQTMAAKMTTEIKYSGNLSADDPLNEQKPISFTVYDKVGVAHKVSGILEKTGAVAGTSTTWTFTPSESLDADGNPTGNYQDNTGADISIGGGAPGSMEIVFDNTGKLDTTQGNPIASITLTQAGGAPNAGVDTVTFNLDFTKFTGYGGDATETKTSYENDGYTAGELKSVQTDSNGNITGTFSNDQKKVLARVALSTFTNPEGLESAGSNLYTESNNSGMPTVTPPGTGGTGITPSALEMSNVNMSEQFSDMIITQRGFQSNSKIITVSDEMLETLVNLKR